MTKLPETESLMGYRVCRGGLDKTVGEIIDWIGAGRQARWLACINPHSYAMARADARFSEALRAADWLIPDGVGILLASRFLGGSITQRVTGSDLFEGVHQRLAPVGGSVFFLGASAETLLAMRDRMAREHPGVRVAGIYSPPFKPEFSQQDTMTMVASINAAAPDVLWVGMTSPKQDLWIQANLPQLRIRFAAGIGAVFDFYAGRIKRSSPVFQKLGLEWLPRLLQEPRRLWRRMLISAPIFLWDLMRAVIKRGSERSLR